MLRKNFVTCSLVRLKEKEQIHLGIGEWPELWSSKAAFTITFFAAVNHHYDHKQRTFKHRNSQNGSKSTNQKPQAYNANVSWSLNVKSAVMYAVVREFLMILSDIFLTRWSKCTNQCDFLVWTYREQCAFYLVWHCLERIEMHQS